MEEEKKQKKSTKIDKLKQSNEEFERGLANGNPKLWHRVLMAVLITFVGVFTIFAIFLDFMVDDQRDKDAHTPVVTIKENTTLPHGNYLIYHASLDARNIQHYLVSDIDGGVVVSVTPPKDAEEPDDAFRCITYLPSSYTISVSEDGHWQFIPTGYYEQAKREVEQMLQPKGGANPWSAPHG